MKPANSTNNWLKIKSLLKIRQGNSFQAHLNYYQCLRIPRPSCAFPCSVDSPAYVASHYCSNGAVPAYIFFFDIHFLVTYKYKIQTIGKIWLLKEAKGNLSSALEPSMELPGHPDCRFSVNLSVPRQTIKFINPHTGKTYVVQWNLILKRLKSYLTKKRRKFKKWFKGKRRKKK